MVQGLLKIVAVKKWEVHQMNVHNAFLHDDILMTLGFRHSNLNIVCQLHKSLDGRN